MYEIGVDVIHGQSHVGTVIPIEYEREGFFVTDSQNDQHRQAFQINLHPLCDDTRSRVGQACTDILGEARHILQPSANLLVINIYRGTLDGD